MPQASYCINILKNLKFRGKNIIRCPTTHQCSGCHTFISLHLNGPTASSCKPISLKYIYYLPTSKHSSVLSIITSSGGSSFRALRSILYRLRSLLDGVNSAEQVTSIRLQCNWRHTPTWPTFNFAKRTHENKKQQKKDTNEANPMRALPPTQERNKHLPQLHTQRGQSN